MGDQRVEAHRCAIDAEIAIGNNFRDRNAKIIGDEFQTILDGFGGISWCG